MLLKITQYGNLDGRKLMDIYAESNLENTDYFFPDEANKATAVKKVEAGFLDFLENDFFKQDEASYWVFAEDGVWISALRICRIQAGLYYLEALETRPDRRKQGYAVRLVTDVLNELKKNGSFRLCSCVDKKNTASLKTHLKSGFKIVSDEGFNYLYNESDRGDYGLEYSFSGI